MGMMSKRKGAAGEREAAAELNRLFGVACHRGRQFSGSPDSPDVCGLPVRLHPEIKRVEKLNIQSAMEQAVRDGGPDKLPIVIHKKNRGDWMATILLDDLPEVSRILASLDKPL